jgi:hypothetical protein
MPDPLQPDFQEMQDSCFDIILQLYGQPCSWTPAAGGEEMQALVLYNGPTTERQIKLTNGRGLSHVGYNNGQVEEPYIEYRDGLFEGLFQSLYDGGTEYVYLTLKDESIVKMLCICNTSALYDGQTYRVPIQLSEIPD